MTSRNLVQTTLGFSTVKNAAAAATNTGEIKLSPEQTAIISCPMTPNMLILASAGSSKTFTMTRRVAYMIQTLGCKPEEFLITTFTRNAASNLISELNGLLCASTTTVEPQSHPEKESKIMCGTFNSLAYRILAEYKAVQMPDNCHVDEALVHWRDFLRSGSEASRAFRSRIKHVFVDEFQDVNLLQFEIVRELAKSGTSTVVVGDDNQNIFAFRGSDVTYISQFPETFAPVEIYSLSTNFRSTQPIVDFANCIASKSESLFATAKSSAHLLKKGPKPKIYMGGSSFRAIPKIVDEVVKYRAKNPRLSSICILGRNKRLLSDLEYHLNLQGIPTVMGDDPDKPSKGSDAVTLSTIHAAKGLEWDHVIGVGLHRDYFPDHREAKFSRERNLFYVLATRARKSLSLYSDSGAPSGFLVEMAADIPAIADMDRHEWLVLESLSKSETGMRGSKSHVLTMSKRKLQGDLSQTVPSLVRTLRGQDYIELKNEFMGDLICSLPNSIRLCRLFDPSGHSIPGFVSTLGLEAEFAQFVELVAQRICAEWHGTNADLFVYHRSNDVMANCNQLKFMDKKVVAKLRASHAKFHDTTIPWKSMLPSIWDMALIPCIESGKLAVLFPPYQVSEDQLVEALPILDQLASDLKFILESRCLSGPIGGPAIVKEKISIGDQVRWGECKTPLFDINLSISDAKSVERVNEIRREMGHLPAFLCGKASFKLGDLLLDVQSSLTEITSLDTAVCPVDNLLQILLYASMLRLHGSAINCVGILNLKAQTCMMMDISDWNLQEELCKRVMEMSRRNQID